ncbi:MAG: hypothetical protein US96_C0010G0017 [Candidatus Woesebacteria bacterium GW2011_GWB1_38_5b]|uniref:NYN domain-containing protein n=1 Tax=Candidatus Woesebacteria bacterium GW2011_GWB1_38_5b TaxID=1618569 RepID=A0A0G0NEG6_9BACT|nr:MAG: hypothetical protein US96_C0010G0017 [Candidatus Woesebacteria bacterium GW2011_GWB1_38_5b]
MKTYAFIDASNLFYGGEKSLGWSIDYQQLAKYLKKKYRVSKIFYFGGIDLAGYRYDYLKNDSIPLDEVEKHIQKFLKRNKLGQKQKNIVAKYLGRVAFYKKLQSFGYMLYLKPVKIYRQNHGPVQKKANCDVEMAFYLMKEKRNFSRVIVLSGDGDFLPVLKYLKEKGKKVVILARGPRTAREIRQFAGSDFRDFVRLENYIKFKRKP